MSMSQLRVSAGAFDTILVLHPLTVSTGQHPHDPFRLLSTWQDPIIRETRQDHAQPVCSRVVRHM